jgi:hypothetical protein
MKIPCEGTWAIPACSSFAFVGVGGMTKVAKRQLQVLSRRAHIDITMVGESYWNYLGEQDVEMLVALRVDRCAAAPGNRRRERLGNVPD